MKPEQFSGEYRTDDTSRSRRLITSLVIFATCFLGLTACVVANKTARFDVLVVHVIQQDKSRWITTSMKNISDAGTWYGVGAILFIAGLWLWINKMHRYLREFIAVALTSYILNISVKALVHRQRPVSWLGIHADGFSFPSGHSIMTFVLAVELVIILRRLKLVRWWMYLLAACIALSVGMSRIYLGVHWPSDVLGSWLMGSAIITFFSLVYGDRSPLYHRTGFNE